MLNLSHRVCQLQDFLTVKMDQITWVYVTSKMNITGLI